MRKIMVIAVREYQAAVKTKAFILSIVLMPVLMGGSIVVQKMMEDKVDTSDKRFAILDNTGLLYDGVEEGALQRSADEIYSGEGAERKQVKPRFLVEEARVSATDSDRAVLELSERVRNQEIFGFVIIGSDVVSPDEDHVNTAVAYHSNSPTYYDFKSWIGSVLNDEIRERRFQAANLDPELVERVTEWVSVANLGLVSVDESGQVTDAKETNRVASLLLPMGMMMLMFMVVMTGATPLMQSVLEEKMQRIAEVLLGSVTPFELMMGKLLGTVGVSLTVATIYLVGAYVAVHRAGFGEFFPAEMVWWFIVFQCMAVLMFGSMFIAIGAAVSEMKEAQSLMTPLMIVVVSPMFVWMPVVKEPLSTFSTIASFFPPATPMLMLLRQAVPPGIPTWQPVLGVFLVILTTIAAVFVAGRIFRVGILMQGKGANFGELIRWAIRG